VFFVSLLGLASLFGLKEWELRRDRFLFPDMRRRLDALALFLQDTLDALKKDAEKVPGELVHLSRTVLHELVLALAFSLRFLSVQAHKLADLVSHKHNFVRRVPRSEFLKKVSEHKNDSKTEVDTSE
jgi:hypothetical protein